MLIYACPIYDNKKSGAKKLKSKKINDTEIDIIVVHNAVVINAAYNITRLIGFSLIPSPGIDAKKVVC